MRYLPPTPYESRPKFKRVGVYADRKIYWDDDHVGQFLVSFVGEDMRAKPVALELIGKDDAVLAAKSFGPMPQPKVELLLAVNQLKEGEYRLRATLRGEPAAMAEVAFARAARRNEKVAFPADGIVIEIEPQSHLANADHPVCTGVPFPQGTLTDANRLALYENGRPVPCRIRKVGAWHPEADDVKSSVRWAHLNFIARYRDGKPLDYRLKLLDAPADYTGPKMIVVDGTDRIQVDTGTIRFAVSKRGFNGIDRLWFDRDGDGAYEDGDGIIEAGKDQLAGPYIVDAREITYEAAKDAEIEVVVEEAGPLRAVIAARGWFANPKKSDLAGKRLCRFVTRFFAYAGRPEIRVRHYTIITFDTDTNRLFDVGFRLPTPAATEWALGLDGKTQRGELPAKGKPLFLHQYRWNRARVVNVPREEKGKTVLGTVEGGKSDGWMSVFFAPAAGRDERVAMSVLVKDIWQKFPKEVGLSSNGVTVHAWPKHGMRTFADKEMYGRDDIYKLRWYHHGRALDLRFPNEVYEKLKEYDAVSRWGFDGKWDAEDMAGAALSGNAQGVSLSSEFCLRFHAADEGQRPLARLYQHDPHARPDPKWNVKTLVEGRLMARDPERFPIIEAELDGLYPSYVKRVIDGAAEYGMWIYTNTHNKVAPDRGNRAHLHRVWQASHYRHVWTPWLLYFRGTPFEVLRWARANTDHFMDVDTIAWADPENARIKWHTPGAMYHAKGFTPWGAKRFGQKSGISYSGIQGHWINPDAFIIRWLIEGHPRARDLAMLWGDSLKRYGYWRGCSREIGNSSNELFSLYMLTRDPDLLPIIHDQVEGMFSRPLSKWPHSYHHPWFNPFWFMRLHAMTRDPRVIPALVQYRKDGFRGCMTMHAMISRETGDAKILGDYMGDVYDRTRAIYRNPGDPLDAHGSRIADPYTFHQQLLYWLQALADAGIPRVQPGPRPSLYPTCATHPQYIPQEPSALPLVVWTPDDREITVKLESRRGMDMYQPYIRVIAPSGETVLEHKSKRGGTRYIGDRIERLKIPRDGERGLYLIDMRNWEGCFFLVPITDAPLEGTALQKGVGYRTFGRSDLYYLPVGGTATLTFSGMLYRTANSPVYVRVTDAAGTQLVETTVLHGSKRPEVSVALDPAKNPAPYRICAIGNCFVKWTGEAEMMALATEADAVRRLTDKLRGVRLPFGKK